MVETEWTTALAGGMLIGLSATTLLAFNGRIAGISGIFSGVLQFRNVESWRCFFIVGMLIGGLVYEYGIASQPTPQSAFAPGIMILGGFLVGVGTRLGHGCTSGHGVCGLGRLSLRSLVAVMTFMMTAILTVFLTHQFL